jgi:hypothetical protein
LANRPSASRSRRVSRWNPSGVLLRAQGEAEMSVNINDKIRVEPIWDHTHGRRFQIIVINKERGQNFTVHKDMMARDYLKLKLSDSDILQLIQELSKSITSIDFDPKIVEARMRGNHLKIIKDDGEGNDAG